MTVVRVVQSWLAQAYALEWYCLERLQDLLRRQGTDFGEPEHHECRGNLAGGDLGRLATVDDVVAGKPAHRVARERDPETPLLPGRPDHKPSRGRTESRR